MASNDEIVMKIDNQFLIEVNGIILRREARIRKVEVFIETFPDNLDLVIPRVNSVGNSGNREQDLIEKATYIIAMISWSQAFADGNRRTGIIAAGTFLTDNGYYLDIHTDDENEELRDMLKEIKKHARDLDVTIMNSLMLYTSERITPL